MSDDVATQEGATVERLSGILGSMDAPEAPKESPKAADEAKPEETAAESAPETEAEQETETEQDSDAEAPEADAEEAPSLPTHLTELAESLGVEPEKLYDLKLKTKIDGQEGEATLAQLLKSYQLEGHLNRKNMEIAEQRKALENETQKILAQHQQRATQLEESLAVTAQILNERFQGIDWNQLKATDPVEFNTKYIEYQQYQGYLQNAFNAVQAEKQQQAALQQQQFHAALKEEHQKLLNVIPEWSDNAIAKREKAEIGDYLKSYGFTDEEVGQVYDHRLVQILRDAKRGRAVQESKPEIVKKVTQAPKLAKPGPKPSKADQQAETLKDLRKQHRSGSKKAGIDYLIRAGFAD